MWAPLAVTALHSRPQKEANLTTSLSNVGSNVSNFGNVGCSGLRNKVLDQGSSTAIVLHSSTVRLQAFVGYRDVDDVLTVEAKDFVGKTHQAEMASFLGGVQATGGGDEAESIASGLKVCCRAIAGFRGLQGPQPASPPF